MQTADFVKESATGTGPFTLTGAAAGFRAFAAAFPSGATGVMVVVSEPSTGARVTGLATISGATLTITSTETAAGTFGNGAKEVSCTATAKQLKRLASPDASTLSSIADGNAIRLAGFDSNGDPLTITPTVFLTWLLSQAQGPGDLAAAGTLSGSDVLTVMQGTGEVKTTLTAIAAAVASINGGTVPSDTTPPTFSSAVVSNAAPTQIVLTMSETLAAVTPAASAFAVSGGKTVSTVAVSGSTVTLTVSSAYTYGDTITVTYTKPGTSPLQDAAGNQTASFGPSSVTNSIANPGDVTPPTASSAAVANATPTAVVITMSEAMSTSFVPAASAFTVGGHTVSAVAISGSTITLTVDAFVYGEAARTVAYTQPGTNNARDLNGNLLASFSGLAITNNVAAPVAPGAPTIGTATAGDASASVTFTAPASNGGAAITGYTVTSSPGGITATGTSSPINVTGLTNGTAYTFTVTATNSAGTGAASAASNSVTPAAVVTYTITNAFPPGMKATLDGTAVSTSYTGTGANAGKTIKRFDPASAGNGSVNWTFSPAPPTGDTVYAGWRKQGSGAMSIISSGANVNSGASINGLVAMTKNNSTSFGNNASLWFNVGDGSVVYEFVVQVGASGAQQVVTSSTVTS